MKSLSKRSQAISPSGTLLLDAKVKELKRQGVDVITFGVGEPDFDTPDHIKEKAVKAIQDGFTKYTPNAGIPELREAVAKKFLEENGISYEPSEILISSGCKQSIYNALQILADHGDEVLVPAPCWVSYTEIVKLAGATPVVVRVAEDMGFKATPEVLREHLSPKTKGIVINTPSNPTGAVYTREELEALASFAVENDLYVVSDEIYETLIYGDNEHVSIASLGEEIRKRTVTVNGVSKAFSMTGWRIGYAGATPEIISAMAKLQSQSTSCAGSISQKAALAALTGSKEPLKKMFVEFKKRRDYMAERLSDMPGFVFGLPEGAFYIFPKVKDFFGKVVAGRSIGNAGDLAEAFLDEARVAVLPGDVFWSPDNIRLSYATSLEAIKEGLDRLEELLKGVE